MKRSRASRDPPVPAPHPRTNGNSAAATSAAAISASAITSAAAATNDAVLTNETPPVEEAEVLASPLPRSPLLPPPTRPKLVLAASGSVASIKFAMLASGLTEWAEVRLVATKAALHFIDKTTLPPGVALYTDEEEWKSWGRLGDTVLHIELRKWADLIVIAPVSANTMAKMANGLCDNLLTCIVRAWDFKKPLLFAPAMNTFMWDSPFTSQHVATLEGLGAKMIPPISKKLACGDNGSGAMAEVGTITSAARNEFSRRRGVPTLDMGQSASSFFGLHSNGAI